MSRRRLERRLIKIVAGTWRQYCFHPHYSYSGVWWWNYTIESPRNNENGNVDTFDEKAYPRVPSSKVSFTFSSTPLTVDELIAMDAIEDGLDDLVETIPGLFVVEED